MHKFNSRKAVAIVVVLLAVVIASGCGKLGSGKVKGSDLPEVYVGMAGVEAVFAPETVPSVTTSGSQADVLLFLSNKGAIDADMTDDSLIVVVRDQSGAFQFMPNVLKGTEVASLLPAGSESKTQGKLLGKASTSTAGSLEPIEIKAVATGFEQSKEAIDTGLMASICYKYATKLTANVCIDDLSYSFQKQRKPCDAKVPVAFTKGQGAPVAVKKIETITEKSGTAIRPKFKIYIGNVGKGFVIDKDSIHLFCTDKKERIVDKLNKVQIDYVELLNGKQLACNQNQLTLTGSAANDFVICSYNYDDFSEGMGTFATPLKVELSYGYTSTSNPIPVKVEKGIQCEEGAERSCSITGGGGGTQKCIDSHWTFCQK